MLRALRRLGVVKREIVATVVGGANVILDIDPRWSVASRNVSMAMSLLEREAIPITYADTGGIRGRVIEHVSDLNRTKIRYHGPTDTSRR
jgi:chemotaxis receptor (MCP) glutamine deamidase CheD